MPAASPRPCGSELARRVTQRIPVARERSTPAVSSPKQTRRYLPSRSTGTPPGSVRAERRPPSNGRRGPLLALRCSTSRRSLRRPTRCRARAPAGELIARPFRPLERRFEVVAERQRQLGSGRDHARGADRRSHSDQGPDDLVHLGTGGECQVDVRLVGARRRVDCERGPEADQGVRFLIEPGDLDRVVAHAEHRFQEALVVQRQAAQRFFVCGHFLLGALHTRGAATSSRRLREIPPTAGLWPRPVRARGRVRPRRCGS